ncbi:SinI family restriction endonuclease [Euryarchaeota archaeon]|nr:SinI family restriction endonuclease [Euryarchaeota archaeon]
MTLRSVFTGQSREWILENSEEICGEINLDWDLVECIVQACIAFPGLLSDRKAAAADSRRDILQKWLTKINNGYLNRPSQKTDTPMTTISDPLIDIIFAEYDYENAEAIRINHRNSMKVENTLGGLLEEYIHSNISGTSWRVAWGESVRAIDLVRSGDDDTFVLLQVKNKYNSENSSSVKVRGGTSIKKWHRLNKDGSTGWAELCSNLGLEEDTMSEGQYRTWVRQQISNNQEMISFEE